MSDRRRVVPDRGRALRRWSGAAIAIVGILVATAWSVRELTRGPVSLDDKNRSRRVIAYEASAAHAVTWKVDPGTDVLRFVAYRKGSRREADAAATASPTLRASIRISGRDQPFAVEIPVSRRAADVVFEASGDRFEDAAAFDLDVRNDAPCEVTVASTEPNEIVLMAWARAVQGGAPTARLPKKSRGAILARHVGEIDWTDLDAFEKETLAERRWHRVAAVSDAPHDDGVALLLRPSRVDVAQATSPLLHQALSVGQVLRANVEGPVELTFTGTTASAVAIDVRAPGAAAQHREVNLPFTLPILADPEPSRDAARSAATRQVDVTAPADVTLELRSAGAGSVNLGTTVHPFWATPTAPLVLGAIDVARVVRITARVALPSNGASAPIAIDAAIETANAPVERLALRSEVKRSVVDRFDPPSRDLSPSEPSSFLVLVPPSATLALRPAAGEVALTLAELDNGPAIVAFHEHPKPPPRAFPRARFVPLHLEAASPSTMRIHLAPPPLEQTLHQVPSYGRLRRPPHASTFRHEASTYVSSTSPLEVRTDSGATPRAVFLRLYSRAPMEVVLRVDGGHPRRRSSGLTTHVTTDRRVYVDGEATAVVLLGDDLAEGTHTLEAVAPPGQEVWIHARWARGKAHARSLAPARWIAGDFDHE